MYLYARCLFNVLYFIPPQLKEQHKSELIALFIKSHTAQLYTLSHNVERSMFQMTCLKHSTDMDAYSAGSSQRATGPSLVPLVYVA